VGTLAAPRTTRRADRLGRLLRTLISERGEATGAALARAVALYAAGRGRARCGFFEILARDSRPIATRCSRPRTPTTRIPAPRTSRRCSASPSRRARKSSGA
jgi:hypothetical protein